MDHKLWWNGPTWLKSSPSDWPRQSLSRSTEPSDEVRQTSHHSATQSAPLIPFDRYSSFDHLKYVTAWVFRFIDICRHHHEVESPHLTTDELVKAESYWIRLSQEDHFSSDIQSLNKNFSTRESSPLFVLHPYLDSGGLVRVGGRVHNTKFSYDSRHPIVLHGKHPITKLIISSEHVRLLHAGPTLVMASLCSRYHIVGCRKAVRSITRKCITCRRTTVKPKNQLMGQLPPERVTPGSVFENVGVDYAGPFLIKYGSVRKPTIIKAYVCVFVSLSVKAVHLEMVSDFTTGAFIATLRRFIARRGRPSLIIWSDHGTNFVGAAHELKELSEFLERQKTQGVISQFCSIQGISWKFIPERAPNFGGLWESAVKSMKIHLRRVISDVKLTFEEFTTV